MDNIKERIKEALTGNSFFQIEEETKEEIAERLFIYHEELLFQNDELKRVNEKLNNLSQLYQRLFFEAPVIYVFIDEEGRVMEYNQLASKVFTEINSGKPLANFIHTSSQDVFYLHFRKLKTAQEQLYDFINVEIDKELHYFRMLSIPFHMDDERFYLISFVDETKEKNNEMEIQYLSLHDPLTDLYNRRFFNIEMARLDVERNLPLGIIQVDINGLKLINDTFGHSMGDRFLTTLADALRKSFRNDEIIARLGGDEFAVLIPRVDEELLNHIESRIIKACGNVNIGDVPLSVAFGSALKSDPAESLKDVLKKAEDRMYQQKLNMSRNYHHNVMSGIIATLHEKHPREEEHSKRVKEYVKKYCVSQKLSTYEESSLETAALLHDIGKIAIDYAILEQPRHLTDEEYEEVRKHSETGYRILKSAGMNSDILDYVLYHHERMDGKGYPRGLKGDEIPFGARLLSVCDAYDAMTSQRPYKEAFTKDEAAHELMECSGTQFDPHIVIKFINEVI